ncbi:unnamed protein product [marine sediment metagenome]|uniref:Uncharacterized protein n=1 Tax=marine sediment metagenome TaxID=412755 RepID=X1SMZ8_9ZZZZ
MAWEKQGQRPPAVRPPPPPRQPGTQRKPGEEWTPDEINIRGAGYRIRDIF